MTSLFRTWAAYQNAFKLADSIFTISRSFPKEEKFSLTDQIRRSSRSVCANLAEATAKRRYPKHFIAKLTDSAGENFETQTDMVKKNNHVKKSATHASAVTRIVNERAKEKKAQEAWDF